MSNTLIKLAMGQMLVEGGRLRANLERAAGSRGEVLVRGAYGEAAETLIAVEIELAPRTATGTAIAGVLEGKGYDGP
jgi:hypothetical protein